MKICYGIFTGVKYGIFTGVKITSPSTVFYTFAATNKFQLL